MRQSDGWLPEGRVALAMAVAHKKVVVRLLTSEVQWGYLAQRGFVADGAVELLDTAGRVSFVALDTVKLVAFVRDFNLEDAVDPERIGRRTFAGRPRTDGLWLRCEFVDGDVLEGLAQVGLPFLEGLAEDGGLFLEVPDARSNTQRVFVPRTALQAVEALGYVGLPAKKRAAKRAEDSGQADLFGE